MNLSWFKNAPFYRLINGLLFYVAWYICLSHAASNQPYAAVAAPFLVILLHLMIVKNRIREFILIATLMIIGFLLDTTYLASHLTNYYAPSTLSDRLAPLWIVSLYGVFATTLNHSIVWLQNHPVRSAFLGALGSAASYIVGEEMGVIELFLPQGGSVFVIATVWFFLLPASFAYNRFLTKKLVS